MSALAWAVLYSAVASAAVIVLLLRSPMAQRLRDPVNERSLHQQPTPRIGGLGVMAGVLPVLALQADGALRAAAAAAFALALVSLRDDWRPLPALVRLAAHLLAALAILIALAEALPRASVPAAAAWLASLLAIAWMTNLFNFMDGADGLAGGMAMIGYGCLGWAALDGGSVMLAASCLAVSAASGAFLLFNFPPARVFLGDAGSIPLGFLAAALGAVGTARGVWPLWFPVLVFSPFIVDASVTLLARALRGEPLLQAHRSHHYQRLVLAGWSHRRLAVVAWVLMLAVAGSAMWAHNGGGKGAVAIILAWCVIYGTLGVLMCRRARA